MHQPVCQAKDEEFNKGRFEKQLLVLRAEVCESWDGLSPVSYYLQSTRQQIVKLLDVINVLLFFQIICLLLVLQKEGKGLCHLSGVITTESWAAESQELHLGEVKLFVGWVRV